MNIKKKKIPWSPSEPALDRFRGSIAATYLAERVSNPVWKSEHEAVRKFLCHLETGASVIDVPFGTGRFVPLYTEKQMSISGIDISPDMLDVAKQELGDIYDQFDIRIGSAESLPYEDGSFDVAVCVRFLESIIPARLVEPCLRELRRVTKRYAIVKFNHRLDGLNPLPKPSDDERIGSRFFLKEIEALLNKTGWELIDSEVVGIDADKCGQKRICLLRTV